MDSIVISSKQVADVVSGRQKQTCFRMSPQPVLKEGMWEWHTGGWSDFPGCQLPFTPFHGMYNRMPVKPGDVLWMKEKYRLEDFSFIDEDVSASVRYSDGSLGTRVHYLKNGMDEQTGWRSPLHMPKEATRMVLDVEDVKAVRVQDICNEPFLKDIVMEKKWEKDIWVWVLTWEVTLLV